MKTPVSNCAGQDSKDGFPTDGCGSTGRRRGVFARPNLNLFVLGALLILVVQALISIGQSDLNAAQTWLATSGRQADLNQLLPEARERPSYELFTVISQRYEKMGDYRRAIHYLRLADEAESVEDL